MSQVSIREARNNLSRLIHQAQAGEEVVIANHGTPVARLVGVARSDRDALLELLASLPAGRGRSAVAIEAGIEEERSSCE